MARHSDDCTASRSSSYPLRSISSGKRPPQPVEAKGVQLPRAGGSGLLIYAEKFDPDELPEGLNVTSFSTRRGSFEKALHPYAVGSGVIHSGHMVHQIANTSFAAGDARVTIQGHGAYSPSAGAWLIYW